MTEYLVIRMSERTDPSWICVDDAGTRRSSPQTGALSEAADAAAGRTVIALVPGVQVLTTSVDLPLKGARLQSALPYALEEVVADDIEDLHFAAGARRSDGRIPVAVTSHANMQTWISQLADNGLQADRLVADSYGLARIPGTISLLVSGDLVYVNDGEDVELLFDGLSPADALAAIGAFDNAGDEQAENDDIARSGGARHILVYTEAAEEERFQHDWLAIRHELESLDVKVLSDGAMPRMAITVAAGAGVNLLQGEYGTRTSYASMLRPWRTAAMLLIGLGVLGFAGKAAETLMMKREVDNLQQQFLAEYQQVVPNATLPRDPSAAIESLMVRAGGNSAPQVFLDSIEQLGKAISENNAASIEAISFRAGVVDVRLTAPDVATLDNIQRAVSSSGRFSATIQSTDRSGDSFNSRIQIREGGA